MTIMKVEDYLAHYGTPRHSGRYPWGSGGNAAQQNKRNKDFLDTVNDLARQGMTSVEIARAFDMSTTELREQKSIAKAQQKQAKIDQVVRLADKGMSNSAIGRRLGMNESSVRALRAAADKDQTDQIHNIADMLRRQVDEKDWVDIGVQVERSLPLGDNPGALIGVPKDKFQTAVRILRNEGYQVHPVPIKQLGTGETTNAKILAKPGTTQKQAWENRNNIRQINEQTKDNGRNFTATQPPLSLSSKRVGIRYAEDGGAKEDGLIYVRPGVSDLSLGKSSYAQVRIAVDNTHYIKGMAVYKHDLPDGVDVVFNTNKSRGTPMKHRDDDADQVLKPFKKDKLTGEVNPSDPFGASIKAGGQQLSVVGGKTKVTSVMNKVNEEGDWSTWKKNLPSQMLSKQDPKLAKEQLDLTYERHVNSYNEIKNLTNPTVKKKLLETFSDEADAAAVHLQAASMPRQETKVLIPIPSMKEHEVYAPSIRDGTKVALVRFPHGGTFEIPQLTVNSKNRDAKKALGNAEDAIGIHHKVAERLSGADFDGDHVLIIPNDRGHIKSAPALEGLKGFDPRRSYPKYPGMTPIDAVKGRDQTEMGRISNLIADMTIKGANNDELAQAVRHSMVVIDAKKHQLDYKQSYIDNGIPALKEKYQGSKKSGAATIISRAGARLDVPHRKARPAAEGGPIDITTGEKRFVPTGKMVKDRKTGQLVPKMQRSQRLAETRDAAKLSSGTHIENLYAEHSNKLKALANAARKEMVSTQTKPYSPSAKEVYRSEVASLDRKLDAALKNAPLERQAQVLGQSIVSQRRQANPGMEAADVKKVEAQALAEARIRTGAHKDRIPITDREWEAIQAGAISNHKLEQILNNSKIEDIKELATPRQKNLMTPTATSRAKSMLASGFTQAEVADALGVSLTTLKVGLSGE